MEHFNAGRNIIRVFSGKYINPFDFKESDIDIEDIAHGLSNQCRWGGHTKRFYSVAEHSIEVFKKVANKTMCKTTRLEALLHDASEAYLLDIPSPYKEMMGDAYHEADKKICATIANKYGLITHNGLHVKHDYVKDADYEALAWEWENIVINDMEHIIPMHPSVAKDLFLKLFKNLTEKHENNTGKV